ncbi:MAG: flagellar brake domain-containing protein [Caryophanon sp.]|nr:flagellar brake domain-containing protein [Caryophanon sp.]
MDFKIGTELTLEPVVNERNERYRCKLVENEEHAFYIDYPINVLTRKTAFLIDGTQMKVTLVEGESSYVFVSEVLGRKNVGIPMIALKQPEPEEIMKLQRREFVRVQTAVDVALKVDDKFYQLTTDDISAGGVAVILKGYEQLEEDMTVEATVVLPFSNGDLHYVMTESKIVRIFEREGVKIASVQFVEPLDVDQQYIVRFCFERQILLRKKEMNI